MRWVGVAEKSFQRDWGDCVAYALSTYCLREWACGSNREWGLVGNSGTLYIMVIMGVRLQVIVLHYLQTEFPTVQAFRLAFDLGIYRIGGIIYIIHHPCSKKCQNPTEKAFLWEGGTPTLSDLGISG